MCSRISNFQDMETTTDICKMKICPFPTTHEIERARDLFITRFIARFLQKHKKYIQLLQENGASLPEAFSIFSVNVCESFEDEVDMIISEKRNKIKNVCRIKGVYSVKGLFRQVYEIVRRARAACIESKLFDVSKQDIMDSLDDIANELAYAYEYQIVMLISEQEVRQLADHAVSCVMNYLKQSDALFLRCNILEALTDVSPRKSLRRAEKVSTRIIKIDSIKGNRYQKWRLSEIFKQPGIRMPKSNGSGYVFYGCFTPYGKSCRPNKYGFRGPIHVWDEKHLKFVLLFNDQVSVSPKHRTEIARDPNDVHQNYEPVMLCAHFEPDLSVSPEIAKEESNNEQLDSAFKTEKCEPPIEMGSIHNTSSEVHYIKITD